MGMFDFRYHTLSLIAVLMALIIGLLLGVAVGDRGLVSGAERKLRESLREDVRSEQTKSRKLRLLIDRQNDFQESVYPRLVRDRLIATPNIGVIAFDSLPKGTLQDLRDSLAPTGAHIASVAVVRSPVSSEDLRSRLLGTRYEKLVEGKNLKSLGERLGRAAGGGRLWSKLKRPLLSDFSGRLTRQDGFIIVGSPSSGDSSLEIGLVGGLLKRDVPVVAVERSDEDRSIVPWFKHQGLSTVDNVDQTAGKAATVFVLAGAEGSFGVKPTATALLPKVIDDAVAKPAR